jgi:small subunit ribosomal protein S13
LENNVEKEDTKKVDDIKDSKETEKSPTEEPKKIEIGEKEIIDKPEDEQTTDKTQVEPPIPKKDLKKPKEEKKEAKQQEKKKDSDFNYIVRIANTDIDGEKRIIFGLTQIKGLGRRMATFVADSAGIDRKIKCGNLKEPQLEKINSVLQTMNEKAPSWILNHRKDYDTGKDLHLIGGDIEMRLRDDVNLLKMIRSYRGIRHESGLRARGQRTRANNRRGLSLGVSKK